MAYNKLRKLLGMKPKADKTTSEKGITTVTDYFPDFSVKEVAEYREDGSQLSVSRYSKGQISEKTDYLVDGGQTFSLYSDGVLTEQTTTRADGEKTVTAFAKGKKTERTTYHPDGRRTVDSFENGKQTGTTDHYPDGSKIISTFSDDFSYQTKINADGSIDYKDRLCSRGGKPITRAFSRESRKTAYINVYVNGFKLGETIGLGHAYKPEQEAESVRQNTLYNAANRAIAKGDGDELEAVTAQALKQKELLDNPQFQSLLNSCYAATKAAVSVKDVKKFQAEFHKWLEASGYQRLQPQGRVNSSFDRMRGNLETAKTAGKEQTPATESRETRSDEKIRQTPYAGFDKSYTIE